MAIIGTDSFYRSNVSGSWGTATDGQSWNVAISGGLTYAVASDEGTITGVANAKTVSQLGSNKSVNFDLRGYASRSLSATTATELVGRMTSNGNYYAARLRAGNLEISKVVSAGAYQVIASTPYTVSLSNFDGLHFQINGSNLYANAWRDNGQRDPTLEPAGWMISTSDSSVQGSGQFGLGATLNSASEVASFDTFSCDDLTLPAPNWLARNPYGVTIGLTNKQPPTANFAYWSYLFNDMKTLGLTRLRFQVSFSLIWITLQNPSNPLLDDPSQWAWGPLDDAVAKCNQEGVKLTFPIRGTPAWCHQNPAMQTNTAVPPFYATDPTITAFLMQQVALRYNGTNGHGFLDRIEYSNEDHNVVHTAPHPVVTLAQAITNGQSYTSFAVVSTAFDIPAGTTFTVNNQPFAVSVHAPVSSTSLTITAPGGGTFVAASTITSCFPTMPATSIAQYGIHASPFAEYNAVSTPIPVGAQVEPARDPYFFVPTLQAASPLIRAASPSTEISLAAIWWRDNLNIPDFLTGIYQQVGTGVNALFDVANLHYYSNQNDPSTPGSGARYNPSLAQALTAMSAVMTQHGDGTKRIALTEIGWAINTNNNGVCSTASADCTPLVQMQRFQATLDAARLSGLVDEYDVFTLDYTTQNRASPPAARTQQSSLVQWDIPSQSYIQQPAYGMLKRYIASYPQWPGSTTTTSTLATFRDGASEATFRAGTSDVTFRTGESEATFRTGETLATFRDGVATGSGR